MRVLVLAMLLVPAVANAECRPYPWCIQQLRITRQVGPPVAAATAAIAAPLLLVGAAVAIASETREAQPNLNGVIPRQGQSPPSLTLLPPAIDPYAAAEPAAEQHAEQPPKGMMQDPKVVRWNETATNVAIAVTAPVVIGGLIYGILRR